MQKLLTRPNRITQLKPLQHNHRLIGDIPTESVTEKATEERENHGHRKKKRAGSSPHDIGSSSEHKLCGCAVDDDNHETLLDDGSGPAESED